MNGGGRREGQSRKCLCKSEQPPTPLSPDGARVSSKEPSVFPLYLIFFLISLFHVCLVPRSLLPPQPPRGRAIPSSAPSRVSYKEKERRRRERETRENPLRNVFGPCAARYYLQSRAYIKYTCREEKGHDERREKERVFPKGLVTKTHSDDELRTKSGGRLIFKFSRFNYASRVFSYLSLCLPSSFSR